MGGQRDFVLTNLRETITMAPLAEAGRFTRVTSQDLGRVADSWIAVSGDKIAAVGTGAIDPKFQSYPTTDCAGGIALPGLIDSHTHPVFAGIRANEFCMRLDGKTYQEIAAAGGGIQSSVTNTKNATDSDLLELLRERLRVFASHGVTTVEMKSGYGLTVDEELRHLRLIRTESARSAQTVYATCLALHAVPKNQSSAKVWADTCARDLLPKVKAENLADAVDAFIENGYFSVSDCENYFQTAKSLGLATRLHADEFSDAGGAECAARFNAQSADHLQFASAQGIRAMSAAGVVATLLPGTSLYTSIPYTDSRPFKDADCSVALATDFNPGSCPVDNLRLVLTMGALHCKLTMAEALAAVTWVAARALRLESSKGALTAGRDADILVMPLGGAEEFVADLGRTKPRAVYARGSLIFS
jgi:imidazolonepropionase